MSHHVALALHLAFSQQPRLDARCRFRIVIRGVEKIAIRVEGLLDR